MFGLRDILKIIQNIYMAGNSKNMKGSPIQVST